MNNIYHLGPYFQIQNKQQKNQNNDTLNTFYHAPNFNFYTDKFDIFNKIISQVNVKNILYIKLIIFG